MKKKFSRIPGVLVVATLLIALLLPCAPVAAAGTTFYVDTALGTDNATQGTGTGADAFATIQYALDDASLATGDIISVAAGTYTEDITIPVALTDLELVGAGVTSIIRGVSITGSTVTIDASGVELHEFTITSTNVTMTGGAVSVIFVAEEDAEIYDNVITVDADANGTGQVTMLATANSWVGAVDVSGLDIHDNTFTGLAPQPLSSTGIYINYHSGFENPPGLVTIEDNVFSGNLLRGIATERSKTTIEGNTVTSNYPPGTWGTVETAWRGIEAGCFSAEAESLNPGQDTIVIKDNSVTGYGWGISFGHSATTNVLSGVLVRGNTVEDCTTGILTRQEAPAAGVLVHHNIILDSTEYQVQNLDVSDNLSAEWNWWGMTNSASIGATTDGLVIHAPYLWGVPTTSTSEIDNVSTGTPSASNTGLTEASVTAVGTGVTYTATTSNVLTVTTGTPATGTSFTSATGWEPLVYFDIAQDDMTAGNILVTVVCTEDVFGSLTGGMRIWYDGAWNAGTSPTWNNTTRTATAIFAATDLDGSPVGVGFDAWEGWGLVSVLPYVFVGIMLIMSAALLATGATLAGIIMLAITIVVGVTGVALIQTLMP